MARCHIKCSCCQAETFKVMLLDAIHTFYQLIVLLNQERNQDAYSIKIVYNILNQDIYKASFSFISFVIFL